MANIADAALAASTPTAQGEAEYKSEGLGFVDYLLSLVDAAEGMADCIEYSHFLSSNDEAVARQALAAWNAALAGTKPQEAESGK